MKLIIFANSKKDVRLVNGHSYYVLLNSWVILKILIMVESNFFSLLANF